MSAVAVAMPKPVKTRKPRDPNAPKKERKLGAKGKNKASPQGPIKVKGAGRLPSQKKILKNPISPWIAFMNFQIDKMGKEDAQTGQLMKFTQKSSMMSSQWQRMTPEEKAPFVEISKRDQARYASQLESLTPEQKRQLKEIKKRKKEKKQNEPKKPKSAFMCFHEASRKTIVDQNPGISFPDVGKKMGAMWNAMSDAEKAPFVELHTADKQRYATELEVYNKQKDDEKDRKKNDREQKKKDKSE